jgi:predicted nucleic acid-binding protein
MDLLADTVFLIDLWREARSPGPATAFAREHADRQVGICWVVAGEFLGGAVSAKQDPDLLTAFLSRYPIVYSSPGIIQTYADIYARLWKSNQLIGPNDLWIAATSQALGIPLLTRNTDEFNRVADLNIVDYTK